MADVEGRGVSMALVLSFVAAAGAAPVAWENIPVAEWSTRNKQFVCFDVPQSNGKRAEWLSLIIDYEAPNRIVGFQAMTDGKLEQELLRNAVYKVEFNEFEGVQTQHILARGLSAGKMVIFDISFRATRTEMKADYKVTSGSITYDAAECVSHPPAKKWRMEEIK